MYAIEAAFPQRHELGEGPHWDAISRRLIYADINAGAVYELDPVTGDVATLEVNVPLSFAIPVEGSDALVCGNGNDVIAVDRAGRELGRLPVEPGKIGNRLNEGKADPHGRVWFGSMSVTREPGQAALYRLDDRGLRTMVSPITLGNGTDWDLERSRMYHIDSPTQRVDIYDYDVDSGEVDGRRHWVLIDESAGMPDGLTVDAEDCVWVCLFQGGAIRRYDPDGALMTTIELPVSCPTSAAFGGDRLSTLFVTTSRHKLEAEQRAKEPLAGAILTIDAGVTGRAGNPVAPGVAAQIPTSTRLDGA